MLKDMDISQNLRTKEKILNIQITLQSSFNIYRTLLPSKNTHPFHMLIKTSYT